MARPYTSTSVESRSIVGGRSCSGDRNLAGSSPNQRSTSRARPASTPASCPGPNRRANEPAVVDASVGTTDKTRPAVSARTRSNPASASCPNSCAPANDTSSCPPDRPRLRVLIGPIPASNADTTPSRSTSSDTASIPAAGVNDGSGAPTTTRGRPPFPPRTLSTERVPSHESNRMPSTAPTLLRDRHPVHVNTPPPTPTNRLAADLGQTRLGSFMNRGGSDVIVVTFERSSDFRHGELVGEEAAESLGQWHV